ncbi:secretin N-terminal domain-containing protein [Mariniblastus fucicola]|uniref:Type II secretion system protein D n=1 Tax=Mariniblastus fucicola TaxID=980251 RepID=A0A5B9PE47_9BACT|nr:secretin N-terminal domain-containing protein [Mariniblastus fucicola]QEG23212.1 Putative type II secretion system protein D precursor [Mariniblastus fucicola]
MKSQDWTLLRKIAATTSFAFLALTQTGLAQQSESTAPTEQSSNEARIRLRTDAQQSLSDAGDIQFSPVPAINGKSANGSLLDSRFDKFPKFEKSQQPVAVEPQPAEGMVAPVAWEAPATGNVPAMMPAIRQIPGQDQQQPGEVAQIEPDNPLFQGLSGTVKIVVDEKTNKLTVIGAPADVLIVERKLDEIRQSTEEEVRVPERIPLRYSNSETISESIRQIYDANYESKVGKAEIVPLKSPNALLVFGSQPAIDAVRDIVNKIESDVQPEDAKDFASFNLKHVSAPDAKRRLEEFFRGNQDGEAFPVGAWTVVADYRSNVIVVRGNAQVIQQAKLLISAIDIDEDEVLSTKSVRVFQLQNAIAGDLAIILQDAINGALKNVPTPIQSNSQGGGIQPSQPGQDGNEFSSEITPSKLQLETVGADGKVVTTGLLFNVRVTPDSASNSIIVRGPASAMPLVAELIKQLDRLPNAETMIKVFQIVNGDAEQLLTMLESIFGADDAQGQQNQTGALAELPLQTVSTTPGAALINLRFAIDQRTNSIIATGPGGDLQVVEDLLNRLDEDLRSRRETVVYRLSNSNVLDVEEALNNLLDSRSDVLAQDPRTAGGAVLADQEIVIVPELGSNSLIISTLPENFPEIENIIRRLDRRPPMVKVKVMMAEVSLGSLEEFGVELGIQDSLLFDRSTTVGADGAITGTGFDFNGAGIANQNSVSPRNLAASALSNLNIGQTNAELGYGGLVLSAGNESINVLLRALKDRNCLRVLSRPHIMTLENLQGRVSVGQSVPRITSSTQTNFGGISNGVEEKDVGVILEITPRVSPDGMITMFVNIVKSSLGQEEDGVAVAVDNNGNVVRQAPINATEAQTTIISRSGQTIVFSGLIQESKQHAERGAPILSDLPFIGPLFKFESDQAARTELLIIMTPYLVDAEGIVDAQNADEMERMHWCLCDVAEVYGNTDFDPAHADLDASRTVYPGGEGEIDWYSENTNADQQQIDPVSRTVSTSQSVKQVGFMDKMKLSLKESPVAKIADRIRGNNPSNRNDRNRRDFEELKELRSQQQD